MFVCLNPLRNVQYLLKLGVVPKMQTFEFVFSMILMKRLLRMTNRLSMVL